MIKPIFVFFYAYLLIQDLELAEYKKSGLKLSRRDLATNEFVPDKHKINYAPSFRSPQEMLMRSDVQNFVSVVEKAKVIFFPS